MTYIPIDTSIVEKFFYQGNIIFFYIHNCHTYTYIDYTCSYENYDILLLAIWFLYLIFAAMHWILSKEPECEEMPALLIEDQLTSEEYMNAQCKSSYLRYFWNYNTALFLSLSHLSIYKYVIINFFSGSLQ